jgi:hypothetical protein
MAFSRVVREDECGCVCWCCVCVWYDVACDGIYADATGCGSWWHVVVVIGCVCCVCVCCVHVNDFNINSSRWDNS